MIGATGNLEYLWRDAGFEKMYLAKVQELPEIRCRRCGVAAAEVDLYDEGLPQFCDACAGPMKYGWREA